MTAAVILAAAIVAVALVTVGARRPALLRIAWRQAAAQPAHSLLLLGGLMLGGAALTASLVAMDSAQRITRRIEILRWDATDLTVTAERPFPIEVADLIGADSDVRQTARAVVPQLVVDASFADVSTRRTESAATLIGFDAARDAALGPFGLTDGTRAGSVGPGDIILNERAATALGAQRGDTVTVTVGATGEQVPLAVRGIARMRGKAAWGFAPVGFVRLDLAQKLAEAPGSVNLLRVVAASTSKQAAAALDEALGRAGLPVRAQEAKREGLAAADAQSRFLRYALAAMSAFMILAGIALIVNLVVMLAEERLRYLGMLRALGMRRTGLVALGALEGGVYAIAAGAAGALAGLGVGALLARSLQAAFQRTFLPGGAALPLLVRPSASSLIVGFAGGSAVGLATVTAAWRRASRLNVPAAVRGLHAQSPSQGANGRNLALRLGALAAGTLGVAVGTPLQRYLGGALAIGAVVSLLPHAASARRRLSAAAVVMIAWTALATSWASLDDPRAFMQLFVSLNAIGALALSVLVAANLGVLERAAAILGVASSAARQVLRPVLSYLSQRPLRTSLTIGIFALVLSLVTAAATVLAGGGTRSEGDDAGFQLVATVAGDSPVELRASPDIVSAKGIRSRVYRGAVSLPDARVRQISLTVYEATPALATLPLAVRDPAFPSDQSAWQAVLEGDRAVGSLGSAGRPLELESSKTSLVNAGSLRAGRLLIGTIVGPSRFEDVPGELGWTYLIRARSGADPAALARSLERTFFEDGLDVSTTRTLLDRPERDLRAFLAMVEFMSRVALAVGVLALGIIGLRAAVERRRMLGTLRALGYRRSSVLAALLTEAGIVTTAGVLVGAGGGLVLNRLIFREGFAGVDLRLLGATLAVTYAGVLVVTAWPAVRAARIPPAEAVRSAE